MWKSWTLTCPTLCQVGQDDQAAEGVIYEGHPTCQAVVSLQFSAAGGQDPPVWQRSASDGEGEGK
jgi:hypothetical protein